MTNDFSANLSLLCSYNASIAEVCRQLKFNRQQFNKYLSGQSRPSRANMRRICDFFGVSEAEILLDHVQFEHLIGLRRKPVQRGDLVKPLRHLECLYQQSQSLDKYLGFYFRYFYSFGNTGFVMRSFASIYRDDEKYYWKNFEIVRDPETGRIRDLSKYEGAVFYLADRIYIMEYETLERNSITQMTLYSSHRHRLDKLVGIQTGGPTRRGRKPSASKVVLEYLGKNLDVKAALRKCGLFHPDSRHIRTDTIALIENSIAGGSFVLDVEEP